MAERTDTENTAESRRRGPDLFTLICGIAALFASSFILTDGHVWWPGMDIRWILTGVALLVGLSLLGSSLRGGRRRR